MAARPLLTRPLRTRARVCGFQRRCHDVMHNVDGTVGGMEAVEGVYGSRRSCKRPHLILELLEYLVALAVSV